MSPLSCTTFDMSYDATCDIRLGREQGKTPERGTMG